MLSVWRAFLGWWCLAASAPMVPYQSQDGVQALDGPRAGRPGQHLSQPYWPSFSSGIHMPALRLLQTFFLLLEILFCFSYISLLLLLQLSPKTLPLQRGLSRPRLHLLVSFFISALVSSLHNNLQSRYSFTYVYMCHSCVQAHIYVSICLSIYLLVSVSY